MEKTLYKIAAVGISDTILKNIQEVMNTSHLMNEMEIAFNIPEWPTERITFPEKVDLILINPTGLHLPLSHIISHIKLDNPCAELIVISFNSSYRSAINAFRLGVRDILNYPFSPAEVIVSLDRALSYSILMQQSSYMGEFWEIISLFSDYRKFNSIDELMTKIELFVKRKFNAKDFSVLQFSLQKNDQVGIHQGSSWGNAKENSSGDLSAFAAMVAEAKNQSKTVYLMKLQYAGKDFSVFDLGPLEQYYYLGVVEIAEEALDFLQKDLLQQFSRITHGLFQQLSNYRRNRALTSLVFSDDVTKLYNKRKLDSDLDVYIKKFEDDRETFSVLFVDIDHFKNINDHYGHLIGSELLVELANELQRTVRESDLIYRYGGDEFVIIIPALSGELACKVGIRILRAIRSKTFKVRVEDFVVDIKLSLSIGVAQYPLDARSKCEILAYADNMMYNAKKGGRGSVCYGTKILPVDQ
ncbi:MAG: diguanylate cyclase [Oligoflexia bacterium]|nr:diguanylate cyclase [Oligoflexia bacterium]MBF0365275.1 diguanylate cyclase [Oligoflexia bacterium]